MAAQEVISKTGAAEPVICYLYILFCGLSGSKPNSERYA